MKVSLRRVAKYGCADFAPVRAALSEMGAKYVALEHQTDYIFVRPDADGGRIKVRDERNGSCLVYVYARSAEESEIEFDYYEFRDPQLVPLLQSLYGEPIVVRKEREIWSDRHLIFHLDRVAEVGQLFEIEALDRAEAAAANPYVEKLGPLMLGRLEGSNEDQLRSRKRSPFASGIQADESACRFERQAKRVTAILKSSPLLEKLLLEAPRLGLRNYYIGAGCIAQTVWNSMCGLPPEYGINDIDLVYYDPDLSAGKEERVARQARERFAALPVRLDVKNQARVHLWYERRFGYPIRPYRTLEEAIDSWPTTATAVGVRADGRCGDWSVYAPFGLDDLFGFIVRPNKAQITQSIYEQKVSRWVALWPGLSIVPWNSD